MSRPTAGNLASLIAKLQEDYGEDAIKPARERKVQKLPTQIPSLDLALNGGAPLGRIYHLYGPEGAGKTTLAIYWIASILRQEEGNAAWINWERSFDPELAESYGLDIDRLYIIDAPSAEDGFDIIYALAKTGEVRAIGVDSITAMVPDAEKEDESLKQERPALQARVLSRALRKLTGALDDNRCSLFVISQIRENVGGYAGGTTVPGGRAIRHYATVRLNVTRGDLVDENSEVLAYSNREKSAGHMVVVQVEKSKVSNPYRRFSIPLIGGVGFDLEYDLMEVAIAKGLIEKKGSWYQIGEQSFQGKRALYQHLKERPDMFQSIQAQLLGLFNPNPEPEEVPVVTSS